MSHSQTQTWTDADADTDADTERRSRRDMHNAQALTDTSGEVFWTDQGNQPLPPEIVQRFKGKVMAITGYEMDQAW